MDYDGLDKSDRRGCLEKAFRVAEDELGIDALLDPEDMMVSRPDEKAVTTYVSELFKYFSKFAKMDSMVQVGVVFLFACYLLSVVVGFAYFSMTISVAKVWKNPIFNC